MRNITSPRYLSRPRTLHRFLLTHILAGACLAIGTPAIWADTTELITVGGEIGILTGSHDSREPAVSADGRYVAFESDASNLVSGDTNWLSDVFVHDRIFDITTRVSVDSAGAQGNRTSSDPAISADGRYVAFQSSADNLVSNDTNEVHDVFLHDRVTGATTRVSVDSAGAQGNRASSAPSINADGRYVAFDSNADNLVSDDTNQVRDVFLHDRVTGTTTRVSVDSAGAQGNVNSGAPAISADGRYVAFESFASNLVSGDTNGEYDVFVHDRDAGTTTRVSIDSAGGQGNSASAEPAISADGRHVTFVSHASNLVSGDTNEKHDIFVHDRVTGATTRVSVDSAGVQANSDSHDVATISADGRYVAFRSSADNLVSGDTNGSYDIFVHDRDTGTTTRVSVDGAGMQGNNHSYDPVVSADGSYVAFASSADNLVSGDTNNKIDVFVHDRGIGTTNAASVAEAPWFGANDASTSGGISADGRHVAFWSRASNLVSGDTNGTDDIFVHDRDSVTTTLVSVDSAGAQSDGGSGIPAITADGHHVAFASYANNLVSGDTNQSDDVFVHDRVSGATTRVSVDSIGLQGNSNSNAPTISADGRYVAFESAADDLVGGDTNNAIDIFVHDRESGTTTRVSVDSAGVQSNDYSAAPAISADARYVAFASYASNLVSADTNDTWDIFVHDRVTGATTRVSIDSAGAQGNAVSYRSAISADGRYVAFESVADNLASGDTNNTWDIFVHDREGATMRVSVDSASVQGNNQSLGPAISADGRYVAFESAADNLVSGDTNDNWDIFVHDRNSGTTKRVSVDSAGAQGNDYSQNATINADGLSILFTSWADNLDPSHQIAVRPQVYAYTFDDTDGDGHPDYVDNCVTIPNGGQHDTDRDGIGNICDADFNDDCLVNFLDLLTMRQQFFTNDSSPIWDPDVDLNNDGAVNFVDLLVMRSGFFAPPGPSNMPNICEPGCGLRGRAFDPTEHFGVELFTRGSFNAWGSAPPYHLLNYGDGVYRTQVEVGAAEHELKIADENWTLEYDAPTRLLLDVPLLLNGGPPDGSPNISLDLEQNGCYNFRIEPVDAGTPPAQVELTVNKKS